MKLEEPVWIYTATNHNGELLGEFKSSIFGRKGWMFNSGQQVHYLSLLKWRDAIHNEYGERNIKFDVRREEENDFNERTG